MTRQARFELEERAAALVTAIVARLPRRPALALGRGLGRLWGDYDRRHAAIAADNLRRAFPHWDEARVLQTVRQVYAYFGELLLDLVWLSARTRGEILGLVELQGREHAEAAIAAGRGVLYVTGHFGHWELNALAHAWLYGPVGVVARPLDNPALERRLTAARTLSGNEVIGKQRALGRVLRLLREGRGVAILVDQNVQEQDGIFVEFFGRPAASTTVAAALALKTGCTVLPVHTERLPGGRYRLIYDPPLSVRATGDRSADIAQLTQQITSHLEGWIRERPERWLWLHRRWKTQPPPGQPTEIRPPAAAHDLDAAGQE